MPKLRPRKRAFIKNLGNGKYDKQRMVTYYQGTPSFNQNAKISNPIRHATTSTGLQHQTDRKNTPITSDKKNPNNREGGMSDLAILVSQQLLPRPSTFTSR